MENDNHEIYGNPRNTGRRGLQVEVTTKSLLWPHSIGIRGPHSSNTKKRAKTSNSGVERNVIRYNAHNYNDDTTIALQNILTVQISIKIIF